MTIKKLKITTIINGTKPEKEYVELFAKQDVDLTNFAILDRTFDKEKKASNIHRHFYKFPNKELKKGEYIRIYTGKGKPETGEAKAGDKAVILHYAYWNMDECIWNNDALDRATLIEFFIEDGKNVD